MLVAGCGDLRVKGAINVDLRSEWADVVGDVSRLPFADGSFDTVLAFDILEHFPRERTAGVLGEWRRVCEPGGHLRLKVPNMAQLCRWVAEGYQVDLAITNIYGGGRWGPGGMWDRHFWGWTPDTLRVLLAECGWRELSNDGGLNMVVEAERV